MTGLLKERYGSPRLNNKDDPLDELFFILLSQMTTGPSYERVFDRLKSKVADWAELLTMDVSALSGLIADAGLANQKAPRMLAVAKRLQEDFGRVSLDPLRDLTDGEAEAFLTTLPGVGVKTAKCVLMYSLGRAVLPVDTHVARVSRRLDLVPARPAAQFHSMLEEAVPAECRYDYHVNALVHGRAVCRSTAPKCGECPVRSLCPSSDRAQAQATAQSASRE
ncbi:hypothetical protein [uncultured Sphingomonas sp.]|uniref:endonuclease III domain-containing protein n=1 Tax=uncultured Sphingomonas sp. TaxID=158754 RepID=UPI0025E1A655|nr:hypothetical protein [uncultured Sphingomonas sp.]